MNKLQPNVMKKLQEYFNAWQIHLSSAKYYSKSQESTNLMVKLPFIDLEMNSILFHKLWTDIYALFMNQNPVSVELVLNSEKQISNAYLHTANQFQMLQEIIPLDIAELSLEETAVENLEATFEKLTPYIKKKYSSDLGNVRIISETVLQQLADKTIPISRAQQKKSTMTMIGYIIDALISAKRQSQFLYYPNSPGFDFLIELQHFFADIQYETLFSSFESFLPNDSLSLTLKGKDYYTSFKFIKRYSQFIIESCTLPLEILDKADFIVRDELILKFLKKTHHTTYNFMFDIESIVSMCQDIFQTSIPPTQARWSLLWQKLLFQYKNFGTAWNCYPIPQILQELFRYPRYAAGVTINSRKISYWAIPQLINTALLSQVGYEGKVLLIYGNQLNNPDGVLSNSILAHSSIFLLKISQGVLESCTHLTRDTWADFAPQLESPKNSTSDINGDDSTSLKSSTEPSFLAQLRNYMSEKYGFISSLGWLNDTVIQLFTRNILFALHSNKKFPIRFISKFLSELKNPQSFLVYPENRYYKYLISTSNFRLIKIFSQIATDQKEF